MDRQILPQRIDKPIDPYKETSGVKHNELYEMDEEERERLAWQNRMIDADGDDTAYENGLSPMFLPAPKGGWAAFLEAHPPRQGATG